jgi:ClpP class serine protease
MVVSVDNRMTDSTLPDMRSALLPIWSTLAAGNPNSQLQNRPIIDSIKLCKLLRDLRENTAVKAVVVRVNSPGVHCCPKTPERGAHGAVRGCLTL